MFAAVWILYASDRLLDARPLFTQPHAPELRERHRFHHRYRSRFLLVITLACPPLLLLLHRTAEGALHLYTLLAVLLGAWLVLIHARPVFAGSTHRLPKELAVGIFFSAAIFIPTVSRAPILRRALLPYALMFACLCSLNCLFLYAWEHPTPTGEANATTRWALRHLHPLGGGLTGVATLLAALSFLPAARNPLPWTSSLAHPAAALVAVALSSGLLVGLDARRTGTPALKLRSLADLVLLTPIPVALGALLWHRLP